MNYIIHLKHFNVFLDIASSPISTIHSDFDLQKLEKINKH